MFKKKAKSRCILRAPSNIITFETPLGLMWMDASGVLFAIAKNACSTIEDIKQSAKIIRSKIGDRKVPLICDTSNTQPYAKEMRDEFSRVLPELFSAVALVPCTPSGRMVGTVLFMGKRNVPAKIFTTVKEAKEWIVQFA